jgi:hypothetical protein
VYRFSIELHYTLLMTGVASVKVEGVGLPHRDWSRQSSKLILKKLDTLNLSRGGGC